MKQQQKQQSAFSQEILAEIYPLLREYFVAVCEKEENSILMQFPCGSVRVAVEEA